MQNNETFVQHNSSPEIERTRPELQAYFARHMREYGMLAALFIIVALFQILTDGVLLKPANITNILLQNSYIIIMAVGMLLVIVAGHIDLSVGSCVGFIGALAAVMSVYWQLPTIVVVPLCLFAGLLVGAVQGYWIAYWKIPSFIVTLAGMLVLRGLTLVILQGQSVGPFPSDFQRLSTGFIPDFFAVNDPNVTAVLIGLIVALALLWFALKQRKRANAYGLQDEPKLFFTARMAFTLFAVLAITGLLATYRGLPNVLIIMALMIGIYSFITSKTTIGRRIYALGGNEKAAKLSGIKTDRLTFLTFANMGMLAAVAGVIFAARLNTATPKAGLAFELDVIAAVFIGGASMSGGVGRVMGAVVGALIMGVMNNGMSILGVGIDWQQVIKGMVLLAAVIFDVFNKRQHR